MQAFIGGIITITLPLLMQDRGIDIVSIGLIYAALPIVFQLTRMVFGILSDFIGRKIFFLSAGIFNIFYTAIYYLASSPLGFLFGKVTEGIRGASIWSVNRSFVLEHAKDKRKGLVQMRAVNSVSYALGLLAAGFLIAWLFYSNTILVCLLIGIPMIPVALTLKDKRRRKFNTREAFKFLDFMRKKKVFRRTLIVFCILGLSYGLVTGYVYPLFLSHNGFSVEVIGLLLGLQMLLSGLFTYLFMKKEKLGKLIFYSGIPYSIILFLLGISSSFLVAFFFLLVGIVSGVVEAGIEGIFYRVADSGSYSTDIGLLLMGFHTTRTISLMLSGFLIVSFGFIAPISLSALIFVGYFLLSHRVFKK